MTKRTRIWSSSKHLTVGMFFTTICLHCSNSIMIKTCSLNILRRRNMTSKYESPQPVIPPQLSLRSMSCTESLESQQENATRNRFLRALLCLNDNFNPGYKSKLLMRKTTSIFDGVCVSDGQLFLPVQCIPCKKCQCRSKNKLVLPKVTNIL